MSQAVMESTAAPHSVRQDEQLILALDRIHDALRGLRFGTVSVIVQDGVVVQVERTEKLRLLRNKPGT